MPNPTRAKGVLILSMPRAGTNWLASLSNATKTMGNTEEWLDYGHLTSPKGEAGSQTLYERTMQRASTQNHRFAVKIFPRQLLQVIDEYNFDFIRKCRKKTSAKIILLEREDRIAQSISLVKAMQTGKWSTATDTKKSRKNSELRYNFSALCQAYLHIGRGYEFWRSYLALNSIEHESFTYEALQKEPAPYFESLAKHLDVPAPTSLNSPLKIQRDDTSTEWRERFERHIKARGIPASAYQQKQPEASLSNAFKVLTGKPAKISRFGYSV